MIPVLYTQSETTFKNNGIGRLTECISCEVMEERNGIYECEFQYPVNGAHYDDIRVGYIIYCMVAENGDKQPFDIYKKSVPIDGIVTFNARHISYRLVNAIVAPFSVSDVTAEQALNALKSNSITEAPFTFHSDKSGTTKYEVKEPASIRAMMGGTEGSILDVYGTGEYYFNLFDVYFYLHRGTDTDVEIRYGKNMIDFENEVDYSQMYNAVVPYWVNSETGAIVTLPEKIIKSSGATPYSDYWTNENNMEIATENGDWFEFVYTLLQAVPMDLSDQFEETPTEAQLRERATTLLENSEAWKPVDNVSVDFVQLWQTPEYEDYAPLQRLRLCDTAKVIYTDAGINARMKVIKTVYDSLLERYSSMELGDAKQSFADVIKASTEEQLEKTFPNFDELTNAIQYATNMITGGNGGYLVINRNEAGEPNELLIMDNPDRTKAVNVWRFNSGGLGHSHNGYDGPFSDVALTMDGKINANMITTGTMVANRIRGGVLSAINGNSSWNLETGYLYNTGTNDLSSAIALDRGYIRLYQRGETTESGILASARYSRNDVVTKGAALLTDKNGFVAIGYTTGSSDPEEGGFYYYTPYIVAGPKENHTGGGPGIRLYKELYMNSGAIYANNINSTSISNGATITTVGLSASGDTSLQNTTINGYLYAKKELQAQAALTVTGVSTFNGAVTLNNTVTSKGTLYIQGNNATNRGYIAGFGSADGFAISTGKAQSLALRADSTNVLVIDNYSDKGTARYVANKFHFQNCTIEYKEKTVSGTTKYYLYSAQGLNINYSDAAGLYDIYAYKTLTHDVWYYFLNQVSDEHLKNIEKYDPKYDAVLDELEPICFTWKDSEDKTQHVGLGARRTKEILEKHGLDNSGLVCVGDNDMHSISYNELTAMLLKRVQDQQKTINDLTARLERLEALLNADT